MLFCGLLRSPWQYGGILLALGTFQEDLNHIDFYRLKVDYYVEKKYRINYEYRRVDISNKNFKIKCEVFQNEGREA